MPISLEQARHYAEMFNSNPDFATQLRQARQTMNMQRRDSVTFFMLEPTGEEDPETGGPTETIQRYRFDRDDMERIDQALDLMSLPAFDPTAEVPIPAPTDDQFDISRYTIDSGTIRGTRPARTEEQRLYDDIVAMTNEPTPANRKETTMHFAIPHPLAEFEPDSLMCYFNPSQSSNTYLDTVTPGHLTNVRNLRSELSSTRYDRKSLLQGLRHPNWNVESIGIRAMTTDCDYLVGIPAQRVPQRSMGEGYDEDCRDIFATTDLMSCLYWQASGRMARLGQFNYEGRPTASDSFILFAQATRDVWTYFEHQRTVHDIADAWRRTSESWKRWAEQSPIDTDALLYLAMVTSPHAFGLLSITELEHLWDPDHLNQDLLHTLCHADGMAIRMGVPTYNVEDQTLSIYRSVKDLTNDRRTTMRTGKALKHLVPGAIDEDIKSWTSALIGTRTPPEFAIGFTKADFDEAYTNGPSSCMTHKQSRYYMLQEAPEGTRPTDALINGDIGIATLSAAGKVTARAVIVQSTKKYIRIYAADYANLKNGRQALREKLEELGYTPDENGLVGQKLPKIPLPLPEPGTNAHMAFAMEGYLDVACRNMVLSPEQREAGKQAADLRAYVMPFIDHSNQLLIEHDDHLLLSNSNEVMREIASMTGSLNTACELADTGRLGGSIHSCGGMVTMNVQALADWKSALRQVAPTPTPTPLRTTTSADTVFEEVYDSWDFDGPAQQDDDAVFPLLHDDGDPINGTEVNQAFAIEFFGEWRSVGVELVTLPNGDRGWADETEIFTVRGDSRTMLRSIDHEYGFTFCESTGEYEDEDEVVTLENGETCLEGDAVEINGTWYHDGDDAICSTVHSGWQMTDDCVCDEDGEWHLATDCYELPDGTYIYEDDLRRAG